jgi:hypothetical protein
MQLIISRVPDWENVYMSANEPQTLRDEYSWATKILDAEYKPASLDDVIKTCENLHVEEQHQFKLLPQKYEYLFDGTLGELNMEPISLQLMDSNCKPIHVHAYTVPRSVDQKLQPSKEIVRLVDIGVLEEETDYSSEWAFGFPSFAIPKKNGKQYNKSCQWFQQTQLIVETVYVTHFLFQRLGKLTWSVQWKGLPLLQH